MEKERETEESNLDTQPNRGVIKSILDHSAIVLANIHLPYKFVLHNNLQLTSEDWEIQTW